MTNEAIGPHMDLTNATTAQLVEWLNKAASNVGVARNNSNSGFLAGWEPRLMRKAADKLAETIKTRAEHSEEYVQACELLLTLNRKHFPSRPIICARSLSGVLDQIDNLTAALVRSYDPIPGTITTDDIKRQIQGEPLPLTTNVQRVEQWMREWLFADSSHWGDRIDWQGARIIAQRLDGNDAPN